MRANIDQVKLNRSVNALVRDLDLGVSIEDLTFGQVDANQLNELFTRLEFGIRTKNRVLRTFNAGKPTNDPVQQDESGKLEIPQYETVDSPEALEAWVRDNLPMPNGHLHDEREIAPKTTPPASPLIIRSSVRSPWRIRGCCRWKAKASRERGLCVADDRCT